MARRELTDTEIAKIQDLKSLLKPGDRVRVKKCPGTKRTFTFSHWDGMWICGKTFGNNDNSPLSVDRVNGKPYSFGLAIKTKEVSMK